MIIDGTTYNIPLKIIKRKADMLMKSAERSEDGVLHAELIGVYYNYAVELGKSSCNPAAYAALWAKITEPVVDHTITMPDETGPLTFTCYFSNISDEIYKERGSEIETRNLTFNIIAKSPARTP